MKKQNSKTNLGFTLIELLVVISIIGLLASIVLVSLNRARSKARDAKRLGDLKQIKTALELYYNQYNSYPSTGSLSTTYWDPGCTRTPTPPDKKLNNWIPGLVPNFVSKLPRDPNPRDMARGISPSAACYIYASDGISYILSAWATVETGPNTTKMYSRAGFRETVFGNQAYLCNHPNIGNPAYGDYYQYSYTLTNVDCTW